ncbi:MAG TPA: protein translocase subunit SecF [Candidatus Stackebrandtia faecavium]|nr:protein translocase subunit SecF [Candidatus Stackebrandtia faecavium]
MATKNSSQPAKQSNNPIAVWRRLYNGDTNFDFIGRRKWLYWISCIVTLVAIAAIFVFPFNWGIEFVGGNQFSAQQVEGHELPDVEDAVKSTGVDVASGQTAGSEGASRYIIRTPDLSPEESSAVQEAIAGELGTEADEVAVSEVSSSWGDAVSEQAVVALVVFLLLVCGYLWFRYDRDMSGASIIGLLQTLIFTAGIYALVGFEVTPNTVIGLLTIMGYSLYDNVVVFDKVHENTKDILKQRDTTYGEGANRAINQTLMRSTNTSIIGLLPVAGLLFVGAGLLGVGTLTDLSLVLFVGIATGTYASLFVSSPLLVDITLMSPVYREHTRKVLERRSRPGAADEEDDTPSKKVELEVDSDDDADDEPSVKVLSGASTAPRPGSRPKTSAKTSGNRGSSGSKKRKKRR